MRTSLTSSGTETIIPTTYHNVNSIQMVIKYFMFWLVNWSKRKNSKVILYKR